MPASARASSPGSATIERAGGTNVWRRSSRQPSSWSGLCAKQKRADKRAVGKTPAWTVAYRLMALRGEPLLDDDDPAAIIAAARRRHAGKEIAGGTEPA